MKNESGNEKWNYEYFHVKIVQVRDVIFRPNKIFEIEIVTVFSSTNLCTKRKKKES